MICRPDCGACCIAPSISSPIPGMPFGKAAGERCVQLDENERCRIFGRPERPQVCGSLQPEAAMCGNSREAAMHWLIQLELETQPVGDARSMPGPDHAKLPPSRGLAVSGLRRQDLPAR